MKGHHGAQLLHATANETPFGSVVAHQVRVQTPLAVRQLQLRAKRAEDGVTEAACALSLAELHTEQGDLHLEKLSQGASAIELLVDILPAGVPHIARLRRLLDDVSLLILCEAEGPGQRCHAAAEPQNDRLCASWTRHGDHCAGGASTRGQRVPIDGVLLLLALFSTVTPRRREAEATAFCGRNKPTREAESCEPPAA